MSPQNHRRRRERGRNWATTFTVVFMRCFFTASTLLGPPWVPLSTSRLSTVQSWKFLCSLFYQRILPRTFRLFTASVGNPSKRNWLLLLRVNQTMLGSTTTRRCGLFLSFLFMDSNGRLITLLKSWARLLMASAGTFACLPCYQAIQDPFCLSLMSLSANTVLIIGKCCPSSLMLRCTTTR